MTTPDGVLVHTVVVVTGAVVGTVAAVLEVPFVDAADVVGVVVEVVGVGVVVVTGLAFAAA